MTEKPSAICWYRSPLPPGEMKKLHRRTNWQGGIQSVGYLATLCLTGSAAFYASQHAPWWVTVPLVFLHGMVFAFLINAIHELGHGTVFRTQWLNEFFLHVFAFLDWHQVRKFQSAHLWHHRHTLHPPDDLQMSLLPKRLMLKNFLRDGFIALDTIQWKTKDLWRTACGRFEGEEELTLYPDGAPEKRRPVILWAWVIVIGQGLIVATSIYFKLWIIPVLITLAPFYGGWLFFLCNNTQHIGLQDHASDFRICCRTFTVNPVVRFLYWHMNYHIEHHMFAAVPCYNLHRLHLMIRHDLPPCHGLVGTWREINSIRKRQDVEPTYLYSPPLPQVAPVMEAAFAK